MQRPQDKRIGFNQGNNLSKLQKNEGIKKTFSFASGRKVSATRIVVAANELKNKTVIHKLNPRRQDSLTLDSVRDILISIEQEGVHTEGVATKNVQGLYELLDSSRRRYSCLHAQKELPLWVIEESIDDADLIAFIQTTQSVKRLSYRELGADYETLMKEGAFTKIDELAEYLSVGRETCRKRYVAASINQALISVFPDCEGIPNGYYAKLAKIEKQLSKENTSVTKFISSLKFNDAEEETSVEDKQKAILNLMEVKLKKPTDKVTWNTTTLADFDDKNTYAKVLKSSDNRGLKIELSRLPSELYDDIIKYVSDKVNAGSVDN
ncbi:chromosome partitioning protein ParB [Photobacterium phosphoreum]|uniref:ParB family protein n=1 Tax=Photobacterium phosphoreum TaxID=659 RepID=UPI000D176BA7|nr:ParB family protein [Photobacterium phosphoreum]PSW25694.1 chromosome partitioning protein ParB [Photobacterium phosphoreum]